MIRALRFDLPLDNVHNLFYKLLNQFKQPVAIIMCAGMNGQRMLGS